MLVGDAVWVLGNLVSKTSFDVVLQVVQCRALPLLFNLFDAAFKFVIKALAV